MSKTTIKSVRPGYYLWHNRGTSLFKNINHWTDDVPSLTTDGLKLKKNQIEEWLLDPNHADHSYFESQKERLEAINKELVKREENGF